MIDKLKAIQRYLNPEDVQVDLNVYTRIEGTGDTDGDVHGRLNNDIDGRRQRQMTQYQHRCRRRRPSGFKYSELMFRVFEITVVLQHTT